MNENASNTRGESELIGSILADDEEGNESLFDQINRSISAPPQISMRVKELEDGKYVDSRSGEKIKPDDPRLTPEYYAYYYSQKPLDPRLPPPLFNWSSKQVASKFQGGLNPVREGFFSSDSTKKPEEDASIILRQPASRKAINTNRILEGGLLSGPPRGTFNGSGTNSSFFSSDAPSIGSVPPRPQSAQPSERLLNQGIRLRLHSATPPADASTSGPSLSTIREQLRKYQEQKRFDESTFSSKRGSTKRFSPTGRINHAQPQEALPLNNMLQNLHLSSQDEESMPPSRNNLNYRYAGDGGSRMDARDPRMDVRDHVPYRDYDTGAFYDPRQVQGFQYEGRGYGKGYHRGGSYSGNRRWESRHHNYQRGYNGMSQQITGDMYMRHGQPLDAHGEMYWDHEMGQHGIRGGMHDYYIVPQQMGGGMAGTMDRYGGRGGRQHRRRDHYGGRTNRSGRGMRGGRGRRGNMHVQYSKGMQSPTFREGRYDGVGSRDGYSQGRTGRNGDMKGRRNQGTYDSMSGIIGGPGNMPQIPGEANIIGVSSELYPKWVEYFKSNRTTHVTLEEVAKRDMVLELAVDQYGSRFIQQRLETSPASHKESAFKQLVPETLRLCTDVFGNYVIQKLFEHGTNEQRKELAKHIKGHMLTLSLQMYGCRVVQKAIDVLSLADKSDLVKELDGHVMKCVRDQNGNHVIQKCIEKVPPSDIQFVVESFKGQNVKLAMHPYGCRVIQRLLEHCSSPQRNAMLKEILEHTQGLAKNQYGNYVIQHVLLHGSARHRATVIKSFFGILLPLSKHKFASNVVEKCVTHATRQERQLLIEEILGTDKNDANPPLMGMVRDQFANYVIQRLIDVMDPEQRQYLIQRIARHLPNIRKIPYGKHIVARIEKIAGHSS